jgi:hypothetical protein
MVLGHLTLGLVGVGGRLVTAHVRQGGCSLDVEHWLFTCSAWSAGQYRLCFSVPFAGGGGRGVGSAGPGGLGVWTRCWVLRKRTLPSGIPCSSPSGGVWGSRGLWGLVSLRGHTGCGGCRGGGVVVLVVF